VDGDMSTNDTVLVLANGLAGNKKLTANSPEFQVFQAALNHVCLELARKIVRDGEGVHRVVTVRVSGAKTIQDADAAARAVANSPLVKTSWHGGDPNWGRIIDAIGYSAATVVEEKIDIGYSANGGKKILWSLKRGQPTKATFKELCAAVAPAEFELPASLQAFIPPVSESGSSPEEKNGVATEGSGAMVNHLQSNPFSPKPGPNARSNARRGEEGEQSQSEQKVPRQKLGGPFEQVQILPSRRGQYKKKS